MFRNVKYPTLFFYAGGREFRFVGGRLDVPERQAEDVRQYAALYPSRGITEVGASLPGVSQPQDYNGLKVKELQAILRSRGLPVSGNRAALLERVSNP